MTNLVPTSVVERAQLIVSELGERAQDDAARHRRGSRTERDRRDDQLGADRRVRVV